MGGSIIVSTIRGTGQPLVLLHAFPLSHKLWEKIDPPPGYQLILPDFPGFGSSPLAETGFTLADAARSLKNHLKQKGINGPFVLGGISMGGYWALEFLAQFPEAVEKTLLISTRPGIDKPEGRQNRLNMAERVEKEGTEFMVQGMVPGLLGRTTLSEKPEVTQRIGHWIRATNPKAVALAQRVMAQRRDHTDLLPHLKAKVLILAGREDALISFLEAEDMGKLIPANRLEILDRVGHLIPIEDPGSFQKSLNGFLSTVD